jgi:two-component system, sensor histidine kinase and response regulator
MYKYTLFLLLGLLCFPVLSKAQLQGQALVDSCLHELPRASEDTNKVKLLKQIAHQLQNTNRDEALKYARQGLALSRELAWERGIATLNYSLAVIYTAKFELDSALKYNLTARQIFENIHDKKGLAQCYGNAASIYGKKGDLTTALDLLLKQQKTIEELGDEKLLVACFINLGGVYLNLKEYARAAGYLTKALKIAEARHEQNKIAACSQSLGIIYNRQGDYKKSLEFSTRSLSLFESLGELPKVGDVHILIASDYLSLKMYSEARASGEKGLEIASQLEVKPSIANALLVLAGTNVAIVNDTSRIIRRGIGLNRQSLLDKAIMQLKEGTGIAAEIGDLELQIQLYKQLSEAYKLEGRWEEAYTSYATQVKLQDSLLSNDVRVKIAGLETKRESDLKEKQIEINKAQAREKRNEQAFLFGGIALLLVVVSVVVWSNRKQKLANRKLAEEKEKSDKLAAELEELNAVKDKLFSAISHDLRSPLGRITNMLYMMQRGNMTEEKLKERTTEFLGAMQQTMQMLDNLLYWATSQMKGLTLSKTNIRISELVDENLELMKPEASVKKIEMIDKIGETANALADANMTRLVLRNLLSNAIKFTPENGSITITAEALADKVRVQVKDTGVGMNPETIQALYASKQVESRTGTQKEKGFGIGLQLCKDFIEQNGGTLEITSEPGQGSTFSFTLPAS